MEIKKVVIAGGGVLGSQIAFQTAFKGFDTHIWVRSEASIERSKPFLKRWREEYVKELELCKLHKLGKAQGMPDIAEGIYSDLSDVSIEEIDEKIELVKGLPEKIQHHTSMEDALKNADLVIEAVSEDIDVKRDFYSKIAPLLPKKTIIATNSSTLLPSSFADYTGRPEKFLALHFANLIWRLNTGEVMAHDRTSQEAFDIVVKFAENIGMIPLPLKKEKAGYILNSLLVPFVTAAEYLWAMDIAEPSVIDLTWKKGTNATKGPFEALDVIGIKTAYNVILLNPESKDKSTSTYIIAQKLKKMIDEGKLGKSSGEGFYKYK